jgi:hypothetical protein
MAFLPAGQVIRGCANAACERDLPFMALSMRGAMRSLFFSFPDQKGISRDALILVRPDGYVGLTEGRIGQEPIIDYLRNAIG